MKGYIAFVKKEFVENLKNYRFLILFAIFAVFGMSSAFLAKFTPEIIAAFGAGLENHRGTCRPLTHGSNSLKTYPALDLAHLSFCLEAVCPVSIPKGHCYCW